MLSSYQSCSAFVVNYINAHLLTNQKWVFSQMVWCICVRQSSDSLYGGRQEILCLALILSHWHQKEVLCIPTRWQRHKLTSRPAPEVSFWSKPTANYPRLYFYFSFISSDLYPQFVSHGSGGCVSWKHCCSTWHPISDSGALSKEPALYLLTFKTAPLGQIKHIKQTIKIYVAWCQDKGDWMPKYRVDSLLFTYLGTTHGNNCICGLMSVSLGIINNLHLHIRTLSAMCSISHCFYRTGRQC